MRKNRGPRDMCGVEDGLNVDADRVEIFVVYDGTDDFFCEFFNNGGSSGCVEMSLLKIGGGESPICGQPGSRFFFCSELLG